MVRERFSSPRFRRRLLWITPPIAFVGLAVGLFVGIPNTAKPRKEVFSSAPVQVYHAPVNVPATAQRREAVLRATGDFIRTAVLRQHLDRSWDLVDPSLRVGMTRREWRSGDIPVVPYPAAGISDFKFDWSYPNDVGLDVVLVPLPHSDQGAKSFMIELKRSRASHGRWLVASWVPHGVSVEQDVANASKGQQPVKVASTLGGKWLFVPLVALALVLLVPLGIFALRGWLQLKRAERAYRRALQ